eukprot:tig00001025_g6359.t1
MAWVHRFFPTSTSPGPPSLPRPARRLLRRTGRTGPAADQDARTGLLAPVFRPGSSATSAPRAPPRPAPPRRRVIRRWAQVVEGRDEDRRGSLPTRAAGASSSTGWGLVRPRTPAPPGRPEGPRAGGPRGRCSAAAGGVVRGGAPPETS